MIRAVFWDFGGVITTSPFEAFARYEREIGLPADFIRTLNATNPDTNAWARFERGQLGFDEFCRLYEQEAELAGHRLDARSVLACLSGDIRREMVQAMKHLRDRRLKQACLTNNFSPMTGGGKAAAIHDLFDVVVESSRVGVRKPDPRFYELACELTGVAPHEVVFLDDLGVNLKPARQMGMTTIKVVDAGTALDELQAAVGFELR